MGTCGLHPDQYTVGWVSALPIELAAAKVMLDQEYCTEIDGSALYTLGRIGDHNVVLGCLPAGQMGTNSAAVVGTSMKARYKAIKIGLMVGIGGGVPSRESDIRLGDVVVSQPHLEHGGVIQYDFGKTTKKGFARTGVLSPPPNILLNALARLRADHLINPSGLSSYFTSFRNLPDFGREMAGRDILFKNNYEHAAGATCDKCDRNEIVHRRQRGNQDIKIHYGTIASGNQVMKNAIIRDELSAKFGGILCFEMEAAGLMNTFPCLVIRGICDYADSHKNKTWQPYAAATAAACAKALINIIPGEVAMGTPTTGDAIKALEMTQGEKDCLQSLYFSEMNFRQNDISDPAPDTCEWLSDHPTYKRWTGWEHPLLWIKGNPGTGKSTLLRHALTLHEQDPDVDKPIVASFFFHGRGTEMQKSVLGLFRSLLHQILQHFRHLLQNFSLTFKRRCETEGEIGKTWNWQEKDLQDFFKNNVPNAATIHPVRVYIDALDESGEFVARKLVKYFEAITRSLNSRQTSLSICFSCRHYPLVSLEHGFEICVDAENHHDIVAYIQENIQSSIQDEDIAVKIQEEVLQRSLSNFQWVVLVLPKVIQSYRRGKWKAIQKYIQDIPSELSQLYHKLIEDMDEESLSESLHLFQWICFTTSPLSLKELRFAMIVDADTSTQSIRECQETEAYAENDEEMRSRVLDLSRGLVEIKEDHEEPVAQLIHQSVKDYLLQNGLQAMSKSTTYSVIGSAHYRLSRSCIRYLSMNEIGDFLRNQDPAERGYDLHRTSLRQSNILRQEHPLIEYAVNHWTSHVVMAEKENVSQEDLLSYFCYPSDHILKLWIQLYQMMNSWHLDVPAWRTTLLHISSEHDIVSVIQPILRSNKVQVNSRNDRNETPLHIAAANGHERVVQLLIEHDNIEVNCRDSQNQTPLSLAAIYGYEAIVQHLIMRDDVVVNCADDESKTPLCLAVENGHEAVVRLLIEYPNVKVNGRGCRQQTPLHLAVRLQHETIIKVLLRRNDLDVNSKDQGGETPLSIAVAKGNEAIVKLLLMRSDIDVNRRDDEYRSPLHLAAVYQHIGVLKLLLRRNDIRVNSKGIVDETSLHFAASYGRTEAVEALLTSDDIDVNSKDCFNETPLFAAAAAERESVVKLLLTRNDIDWAAPGRCGRTPLDIARRYGNEAIVKMLTSYIQRSQRQASAS